MATTKKTTDETTLSGEEPAVTAPPGEDLVQMASVRKDGTPDQTPGFKFIDEEEGRKLLAAQQESVKDPNRDAVRQMREEAK